jgi:hypothetical protein
MKKKLPVGLFLFFAILGMSSTVGATTILYVEKYDPVDILLTASGPNNSVSWIFDITDNLGWNTPDQLFRRGKIKLNVADDKGQGDGSEKALLAFEGDNRTAKARNTKADINSDIWKGNFFVNYKAVADGKISVTLTATKGDFWFRGARLTVASYSPESALSSISDMPAGLGGEQGSGSGAAPVPEPTTMLLFGTGLAGLAAVVRRKRN